MPHRIGMLYSHYILGSRSPRRRELLQLLVPAERIVIKPPTSAAEAGFAGLTTQEDIATRLHEIVDAKRCDVDTQLTPEERQHGLAIVADTIIIVANANGVPMVLGQPPDENWQQHVHDWFAQFYSGRSHQAWTGICAWNDAGRIVDEIFQTTVTFRPIPREEIEWYVATGESRGKAGGYALQGLASVFVSDIHGSLSNVVGLPLEALLPAFRKRR